MAWACLMLAVIFLLLFLHPYVIYPLLLGLTPKRPIQLGACAEPVSATLVFCAYNEEKTIASKLENLRRIQEVAPDIRFMAYVDLSSDRTLEILREHSELVTVIGATERTGKAVGMAKLANCADTEIIIFTDANVIVEPDSVVRLRRYFSDPTVGGVCGTLIYTNPGESPTAATGTAYWRLEEYIKKGESRSGSTMGADGSLFATRRRYYPAVPPHLLDDFIVSMSIVFARLRLISAPDVVAYEKSAVERKDELRRKRRIACRAYSSHRHIFSQVLKLPPSEIFKYVSHRMLRWYSGFTGAAAIAFALAFILLELGPVWAGAAAVAGVACFYIGRLITVPGLTHVVEAASAIYAASLGVVDSWMGKTYQTWQPAQSR